jgi:hypothetical protein
MISRTANIQLAAEAAKLAESRPKSKEIRRRMLHMRSKLLVAFGLLLGLAVLASGCGSDPNCPTCGTTVGGAYQVIDVVPVPEHNPSGEPGGPFNSFDISWVDTGTHRFYVSDRIGLDVPVMDTQANVFLYSIGGDNVVSSGTIPSPCDPTATPPIPPLQTAYNASLYVQGSGDPATAAEFTRFGCRTKNPPFYTFNLYGQFGASGDFGGWAGAQCCASRSNGVNPISCPCGEQVTSDGRFLIVGNSTSSVVVFDLKPSNDAITAGKMASAIPPPVVIATIPTGSAPDFDGQPNGVSPCVAAWTGRAGSDPSCGDDRGDELSLDEEHSVLMIDNGDPGQPFVTLIDLSGVLGKNPSAPGGAHCYPVNADLPYNNLSSVAASGAIVAGTPSAAANPPQCIIGQIFYDGGTLNSNENDATITCPFPSNGFTDKTPVPAGIAGAPCVHDNVAPAGLGGSMYLTGTGLFITSNPNNNADPHFGAVEVVDPTGFSKCSGGICPVVTKQLFINDCMPGSEVQGPGAQVLIGCITHDGMQFPPVTYLYDFTTPTSPTVVAAIDQVGGVDEVWFNPGDQNYYLAARDMPNGPVMGVINATDQVWLMNAPTNSNSHSISADSSNNHIFVPMQSGGPCGTQRSDGCVGVFARQ